MTSLKIALVSPSGSFSPDLMDSALKKAGAMGLQVVSTSPHRLHTPSFLAGSTKERLDELYHAESLPVDALWCSRGGCGALTLWHDYEPSHKTPLIGYSDSTILHFLRFYKANLIGIHGPVFLDFAKEHAMPLEALEMLLLKQAEKIVYPALRPLNHFIQTSLEGPLIAMNLISLQSLIGCFDAHFFHGKILALEEVNEPPYKIFRTLKHLQNAGILAGIKALCVGHIGPEREIIIKETIRPLADDLGIALFEWPIFGHSQPNWPLLFGARVNIAAVDENFFTLRYIEQHDHETILHRT